MSQPEMPHLPIRGGGATQEKTRHIISLLPDHSLSYDAIAKTTDATLEQVKSIAQYYGLQRRYYGKYNTSSKIQEFHDRNEQIRQMAADHPEMLQRQIARSFGMSGGSISHILGGSIRNPSYANPRSETLERNERVIEMATKNPELSHEQISKEFGISRKAIGNILGAGKRKRNDIIKERNTEVIKMAVDNPEISTSQLGKEFDLSHETVDKILSAHRLQQEGHILTDVRAGRNFEIIDAAVANPDMTEQELGEQFGLTQTGISEILLASGVRRRDEQEAKLDQVRDAVEQYVPDQELDPHHGPEHQAEYRGVNRPANKPRRGRGQMDH